MKGLLLKDIYGLKKFWKTAVVFVGIFFLIGMMNGSEASFVSGMIVIYAAMLTITSFAIEEAAMWNQYALSMPLNRFTMVLEKYILSIILSLCGVLLSAVMVLMMSLVTQQKVSSEVFLSIGMVFFVGMILVSFFIPLLYRFGSEKARLMLFLFFAIPFILIFLIEQFFPSLPDVINFETVIKLTPFLTIVVMSLSFVISNRIVKKKEF